MISAHNTKVNELLRVGSATKV